MKLRPLLSSVLPELETLSQDCESLELATVAGELRVCIATLGVLWSRKTSEENHSKSVQAHHQNHTTTVKEQDSSCDHWIGKHHSAEESDDKEQSPIPQSLEKVFSHLRDPLLPVQGHGLIELTQLIEKKDHCVIEHLDFVLMTLNNYLEHEDSYIYLAAIRGIVATSSINTSKVITLLCERYVGFKHDTKLSAEEKEKGLYCNNEDSQPCKSDLIMEKVIKIGEALVKVTECLGDALPFYADQLMTAFLVNGKSTDSFIRASALSNLAEVCGQMKFTFTGVENEVCIKPKE